MIGGSPGWAGGVQPGAPGTLAMGGDTHGPGGPQMCGGWPGLNPGAPGTLAIGGVGMGTLPPPQMCGGFGNGPGWPAPPQVPQFGGALKPGSGGP